LPFIDAIPSLSGLFYTAWDADAYGIFVPPCNVVSVLLDIQVEEENVANGDGQM